MKLMLYFMSNLYIFRSYNNQVIIFFIFLEYFCNIKLKYYKFNKINNNIKIIIIS